MVVCSEGDIEPAFAQHLLRVASCTLADVYVDKAMLFLKALKKFVEEPTREQSVDADSQTPFLSSGATSRRFDRGIENFHRRFHLIDEFSSGTSQPDATCIAVEENDADLFFKRFHARTDAGLADSKSLGCVPEAAVVAHSQYLAKRNERNFSSENRAFLRGGSADERSAPHSISRNNINKHWL